MVQREYRDSHFLRFMYSCDVLERGKQDSTIIRRHSPATSDYQEHDGNPAPGFDPTLPRHAGSGWQAAIPGFRIGNAAAAM